MSNYKTHLGPYRFTIQTNLWIKIIIKKKLTNLLIFTDCCALYLIPQYVFFSHLESETFPHFKASSFIYSSSKASITCLASASYMNGKSKHIISSQFIEVSNSVDLPIPALLVQQWANILRLTDTSAPLLSYFPCN